MWSEMKLKKAGITIRTRTMAGKKGILRHEHQVVDGRKIVSRHVLFDDAMKAATAYVKAER